MAQNIPDAEEKNAGAAANDHANHAYHRSTFDV
jgi:hypothetical protein